MKYNFKLEKGQAIVMIAIAIVGLVGFTALAIDGGNAFSDRRHAQNAADTGVLAAALAKLRGNDWNTAGFNLASNNGYDNSDINQSVYLHTCDDTSNPDILCPAPFNGDNEYVHMVIESNVDTFFAPVVGIAQVTNTVEAIARAKPSTEMFDGNAMVSVCPDGRATFETNGGPGTEVTGGGIFVNSDADPCAFEVNGGVGTFTVPSITVVGQACPDTTAGGVTPTEGAPAIDAQKLDYSWLDEAIGCASATPYNAAVDLSGSTITPHTSPMLFSNAFPPSGVDTLEAGIYCLEDVFKVNDAGAILNGTDVTFVMLNKGITINGGEVRLSAPQTGPTTGLLFYQPESNDSPSNNASISGNTILELTGTILAPGVEIGISGGAGTLIDGQIIGCEISLSGSSGSTINYDNEKNINDPPEIELTQ